MVGEGFDPTGERRGSEILEPFEQTARDDLEDVVSEVRGRGVPLAMVLSGGYGPLSWEAHARSIEGILARFDGGA